MDGFGNQSISANLAIGQSDLSSARFFPAKEAIEGRRSRFFGMRLCNSDRTASIKFENTFSNDSCLSN